jgi:hypothetical protein
MALPKKVSLIGAEPKPAPKQVSKAKASYGRTSTVPTVPTVRQHR